jgi:hypothetical protein
VLVGTLKDPQLGSVIGASATSCRWPVNRVSPAAGTDVQADELIDAPRASPHLEAQPIAVERAS